jgi:hypothetical protein
MLGDGKVYVPGTPSPPNPVTGSKIGDCAILLISVNDKIQIIKEGSSTYGTPSLSPSLAQSQKLGYKVSE